MELAELREKIDRVDGEIIRLFAERMEICAGIAEYKRSCGMPVFDGKREKEKLDAVRLAAPEGMEEYTCALFSHLMELSRAYQRSLLPGEEEKAETVTAKRDDGE